MSCLTVYIRIAKGKDVSSNQFHVLAGTAGTLQQAGAPPLRDNSALCDSSTFE